jgi:hypothetical protein
MTAARKIYRVLLLFLEAGGFGSITIKIITSENGI